jgi:hypothetical protein
MSDRSLQIEELKSALPSDQLWGAFRVQEAEGSRIVVVGWVLGIGQEVKSVQIRAKGSVVASAAPTMPRPEVAEQFPDRDTAGTCGFGLTLEAKGKGASILVVEAVLEDGTTSPMGEIRAMAPVRRWTDVLRRS